MTDEEKGMELPEDQNAADDVQQAEADPTPESPPEEINADSTPEDKGADPDVAEPQAGDVAADGDNQLLSQDDIDNVLGDMADNLDDGDLDGGDAMMTEQAKIQQADFQQLSQTSDEQEPRNIELLMDVDLPVSIELGRTKMNISDILALGPGSIVELDKLVGEPVDLLVNKKCVARGEVVVVEESFGLRITMLVSPEERLKNLT